jgi:hypothetical protein
MGLGRADIGAPTPLERLCPKLGQMGWNLVSASGSELAFQRLLARLIPSPNPSGAPILLDPAPAARDWFGLGFGPLLLGFMFWYFCSCWGPKCSGKWAYPLGLCLGQICSLLFLCIFYPIWPTYVPFPFMPCKTSGTPKLVEYVSVKPYSVSLVCVLLIVGGINYVIRTANKLPHTCSFACPRANLGDKSDHEHRILRSTAIH